jgi:hypothetical protein
MDSLRQAKRKINRHRISGKIKASGSNPQYQSSGLCHIIEVKNKNQHFFFARINLFGLLTC